MNKQEVSLVIPAYNEEKRILLVLTRFCQVLPDQEIIVVCDGCNDSTYDIVKRLSCSYPQVKIISLPEKSGKGKAIISGMIKANNSKVGFVDADESVEPDDLLNMFASLEDNDCVIASRRINGAKILIPQPIMRRFASKSFNILVRVLFALDIKDTQCGAKVFQREAVRSIINEMVCTGFEFDVELLWKLKKRGYKIKEFPIKWKHAEGSRFSLKNAPGMFISLLKVKYGRH